MGGLGGFSWKRLLGVSGAKSKLSRKLGVPLTRSGRQRKIGKGLGCGAVLAALLGGALAALVAVVRLLTGLM